MIPDMQTAILLDFDGVLADTEPLHWQCWNETLRPVGLQVSWEDYQHHCIGISDREFLERLGSLGDPPRSVQELMPYYPMKKELFRRRATTGQLVPVELKELLGRISPERLAVVTSSSRQEIEPILRAEQIDQMFGAAVYGDDVSRLKPDPEPYQTAMERLGASRAIALEDSGPGLESARRAGCEVIQVSHPREVAGILKRRLGL
ncbi:MAG: HAD family hydrolase [Bryobacteraceae bacterium]